MASCACTLSLNHAEASNINTYIINKTGPSHYWLFTTHQVFYHAIMVFKSHYQSLVSCQLKMIMLLVNQPYKKNHYWFRICRRKKKRTVDKCMYIAWQRIFIWPVWYGINRWIWRTCVFFSLYNILKWFIDVIRIYRFDGLPNVLRETYNKQAYLIN